MTHWGYLIGTVLIVLFVIWQMRLRQSKKKLAQNISNYIIISEDRTASCHKLLLKYFDGIKAFEYPIRKNAVLEIKAIGSLAEGLIQIILVDEYGKPIKSTKNIQSHIMTYRAKKEGRLVIKLIGYHAKGKFGIECNISD